MSYPAPGDPQQPYGYRPQPQRPYQPVPPDKPEEKKSNTGKWVTGLTVAASIATILTLFITLNQPSGNPAPNTGGGASTTVNSGNSSGAYPASVQSNFLTSCEVNGSAQACQCTLSWFESNVSLTQFEHDEATLEQGSEPADIVAATQACGG